MRYKIKKASGNDLELTWGDLRQELFFEPSVSVQGIKEHLERYKTVNYAGYTGSPESILEQYKNNILTFRDPELVKEENGVLYLGDYGYTLEITGLDDLQKLIKHFDSALVLHENLIIIYDDYLE